MSAGYRRKSIDSGSENESSSHTNRENLGSFNQGGYNQGANAGESASYYNQGGNSGNNNHGENAGSYNHEGNSGGYGHGGNPGGYNQGGNSGQAQFNRFPDAMISPVAPSSSAPPMPSFNVFPGQNEKSAHPPPYAPPAPPPSGYRIALQANSPFPSADKAGTPPCADLDGSPIYIGSAIFERSVHPCKVGAHLGGCNVPYGGEERQHSGRYDLLPFQPHQMEFVKSRGGQIPPGRRPVEGGYEEGGEKLYHGVITLNGIRVPGKTAPHLNGCNAPFGGGEHASYEHEILCWK